MFFVKVVNGRAIEATTEYQTARDGYQTRHDWKTMARAEEVAAQLTETLGTLFLATDAGASTSPRFDVIAAPVLGQEVSKYFNGDSYPEGVITKISASLKRIETSTGCVFFRRRATGAWVEGRTWSMTFGHESLRNPSF